MSSSSHFFDEFYAHLSQRRHGDPSKSYTAQLLSRGTTKIAQKVGEEATECVIEAVKHDKKALISESSDLLYHLFVLWISEGITPQDVVNELQRREGVSGLTEKANRQSHA